MPRKRRRLSRLGLVYFVLLTGLLFGGSFWLDRQGEVAEAAVRTKREEITVQHEPQGGWWRWYRVGVEFSTRDGGLAMATLTLPRERYDALRLGDRLAIHYLPAFPLFARAADRTTWQAIQDAGARLAGSPFLAPFLTWLVMGLIALWVASRVATPLVVVVGVGWIAAAFAFLFPAAAAPRPGPATARARVAGITLVAKVPERRYRHRRHALSSLSEGARHLAVPYQVVELRFAVPGRPDSVLAVDAVDSGSVAGLEPGAGLAVRYDPRAPREARLAEGARTFLERNRYHLRVPIVGVGLLGLLGAWGVRVRRIRQRKLAKVGPQAATSPV